MPNTYTLQEVCLYVCNVRKFIVKEEYWQGIVEKD